MKEELKPSEESVVVHMSKNDCKKWLLGVDKAERRVCTVCGCANEPNALMCKLCSNYFDERSL